MFLRELEFLDCSRSDKQNWGGGGGDKCKSAKPFRISFYKVAIILKLNEDEQLNKVVKRKETDDETE